MSIWERIQIQIDETKHRLPQSVGAEEYNDCISAED